jgi:putative ABC transport system ATP-binding protein
MSDPVINITHLCKDYITDAGTFPVLHDVAFKVMPGEFVAIMGPSGSGKSTFMNILGCLDVATSGEYFLNGQDVGKQSGDWICVPGV